MADLSQRIIDFARDLERKADDLKNKARDLERMADEAKVLEKEKME